MSMAANQKWPCACDTDRLNTSVVWRILWRLDTESVAERLGKVWESFGVMPPCILGSYSKSLESSDSWWRRRGLSNQLSRTQYQTGDGGEVKNNNCKESWGKVGKGDRISNYWAILLLAR